MKSIKIIIGVILSAALITATSACAASSGKAKSSPSPTVVKKPVTIAAPQSADIDNVRVKVTGTAGDTLDVYAIDGGWKKTAPSSCTDTSEPTRSVRLGQDGTDTVTISVDHPGVWWWVVSSVKDNVTSKCGKVSTIATYQTNLTFSGPNSPTNALNAYTGDIKVGTKFSYWVSADADPPAGEKGWPVTVKWIGPFNSGPEARTGCAKHTPVGAVSTGKATAQDPGLGGGGKFDVVLHKPGVYALVASSPGSEWTAPVTTACDDSTPYLVAQ